MTKLPYTEATFIQDSKFSEGLKDEGNKKMKEGKLVEALHFYNQSIQLAPRPEPVGVDYRFLFYHF